MIAETLIITALGFIVRGIKNSKGGKLASDEMSVAIWDWVKPLFLTKDESATQKLETDPDRYSVLGEHMLDDLTQNDDFRNELNEWIQKLKSDENKDTTGVRMYHSGSGDNVAGNKILYNSK